MTNSVTYASLRVAEPKEVCAAQGNRLHKLATLLWKIFCKALGTYEIYCKGADILKWQTSRPQQLMDRFWLWYGYKDLAFLRTFDSIIGPIHFIERERRVGEAFLSFHRNDEVFKTSVSMEKIYHMLQETFPENDFCPNDFIMTCDPENTTNYRDVLKDFFHSNFKNFKPILQTTIQKNLKDWQTQQSENEKGIEITNATRLYASSILSQYMFGYEIASTDLANCINFINSYNIKSLNEIQTKDDDKQYHETLPILAKIVNNVLDKGNIPLFQEKHLTSAQRKATIFMLLFAGQETTATLLSYIIWKLALDRNLQDSLVKKITSEITETPESLKEQHQVIRELFTQCIREFPPAYGIARVPRKDIILQYQLENEKRIRTRLFSENDTIILNIAKITSQISPEQGNSFFGGFVFGGGPHACPGMSLAYKEITQFIEHLLKNYIIETKQKEVKSSSMVTLSFTEPIYITMTPRN
jgi:cytochrome P450